MEDLKAELTQLAAQFTKHSDDTRSALMAVKDSLKAMVKTNDQVVENIHSLNNWAPAIDDSIRAVHKTLEEVGTRVAILESERPTLDDRTPRPDGHRTATTNQGTVTTGPPAMAPALAKGTRTCRHSHGRYHTIACFSW